MNVKHEWSLKHGMWVLKNGIPKILVTLSGVILWLLIDEEQKSNAIDRAYTLGYEDAMDMQNKNTELSEKVEEN